MLSCLSTQHHQRNIWSGTRLIEIDRVPTSIGKLLRQNKRHGAISPLFTLLQCACYDVDSSSTYATVKTGPPAAKPSPTKRSVSNSVLFASWAQRNPKDFHELLILQFRFLFSYTGTRVQSSANSALRFHNPLQEMR